MNPYTIKCHLITICPPTSSISSFIFASKSVKLQKLQQYIQDGSVRYSAEKAFDANPDTNAVSQDNIAVWFYGQLSERFSSLRLTIHG